MFDHEHREHLELLRSVMAAIDDLNTAVAALQTEQAGLTTLIAQALAALAAGSTGAQDPAIEAAATAPVATITP